MHNKILIGLYIIPYTSLFLFDKISTTKQSNTATGGRKGTNMKMKVVGMNLGEHGKMFIQTISKIGWKQMVMSKEEFYHFMITNFNSYVNEYNYSGCTKDFFSWCYEYGETGNDTYVFE